MNKAEELKAELALRAMKAFKVGDYVTFQGGWGRISKIDAKNTAFIYNYAEQSLITSTWRAMSNLTKLDHYDPKLLKPFDKVLCRDKDYDNWEPCFFQYINGDGFRAERWNFDYCIPYNTETEHLVGTCDEAPEFYR